MGCGRSTAIAPTAAGACALWSTLLLEEERMSNEIIFSRTVAFDRGSVALHDDGTITFHFRRMEVVYAQGSDSDDGMRVTIDKETSASIKRLFRSD